MVMTTESMEIVKNWAAALVTEHAQEILPKFVEEHMPCQFTEQVGPVTRNHHLYIIIV